MATNMIQARGEQIKLPLAGASSGDPVVVGQIPGVALIDTDADGNVVIQTVGVFHLPITGAVTLGALVYATTDVPAELSTTNTGVRFGYALAAGEDEEIDIKIGY